MLHTKCYKTKPLEPSQFTSSEQQVRSKKKIILISKYIYISSVKFATYTK